MLNFTGSGQYNMLSIIPKRPLFSEKDNIVIILYI